jgi:hypothetical protein
MAGKIFDPALWGVLVPALLLMLVLSKPRAPVTTAALGVLAATFVVYMTTPFAIEWLLSRSVTRVVIGPVGMLALVAATTGPWRSLPPDTVADGGASAPREGDTAPAQPSDEPYGRLVGGTALHSPGGSDDVS